MIMESNSLYIKEISSMHLGGRNVTLQNQPKLTLRVAGEGATREVDLNGTYVSEQIYAQTIKLAAPICPYPVMFWHGGAMTGVTWESTPDGRPGWQWQFLKSGFNVITSDAVERGRSSWSPFPQIYKEAPIFRTQEETWHMFRFGTQEQFSQKKAYKNQRFPLNYFDNLCAQLVPRWTNHDQMTLTAYQQLLQQSGPVIIVAHSQGGWLASNLVHQLPHLIKAVILIEPAGAMKLQTEQYAQAAKVPHLVLWGDYIDEIPMWKKYRKPVDIYMKTLQEHGGVTNTIDLPSMGIRGNSHVPMMDNNSDELASMLTTWIKSLKL